MLYLKSLSDIAAIISGPDYASIDLPTKNQIADHFEAMPASVLEAAYDVIVASLPTDEANFATALFTDAPPAGGSGSGTGGGTGGDETNAGDYVFRKDLTAVSGGAATDLDAVATASLPTGILFGLCLAAEHSIEAHYQLRQRVTVNSGGTGSGGSSGGFTFYANGTTVVQPVDHGPATNDRVWVRTQ